MKRVIRAAAAVGGVLVLAAVMVAGSQAIRLSTAHPQAQTAVLPDFSTPAPTCYSTEPSICTPDPSPCIAGEGVECPGPIGSSAVGAPAAPASDPGTGGASSTSAAAPATAAPAPIELQVHEMYWCDQCPANHVLVVTARVNSSQCVAATGTVTVRFKDGAVASFSGSTDGTGNHAPVCGGGYPDGTGSWSITLPERAADAVAIRLDFTYQGVRSLTCSNPCI